MAAVLAIDLGTESARVGAFTTDGDFLSGATEGYLTTYPQAGWAEQDPLDWWDAIVKAVKEVLSAVDMLGEGPIVGISTATTSSTVVVLDDANRPIRPAILWMDARAAAEAEETARFAKDHSVLAYSGGSDAAEWLVPKAMWLARHENERYRQCSRIVEALDYITWRLTGEWTASLLNATCKWNFDPINNRFPIELYESLGIPGLVDRLPNRVARVGSAAGELIPHVAEELGIHGTPVVAVGGIDAHVSLQACGPPSPGLVSVVAGTSTVFITEHDEPIYSSSIWGPYPGALHPGQWLMEGGQISSGSVLNWAAATLTQGGATDRARLIDRAAGVEAASHGLLVLDYFMGNRTPYRDPHLRGAILGLTVGSSSEEIYRATVEGVCFGTKNVLESWRQAGIPVDRIVVSGGIRKNRLWLQTTADVLKIPLDVVTEENLTLRAGAIQAAVAAGCYASMDEARQSFSPDTSLIDPNPSKSEALDEAFEGYLAATLVLRPYFRARRE